MNKMINYSSIYKSIFFLSLFIAPFSVLQAEGDDGRTCIKETVITNEGLPAPGVIVSLEGTKRNTSTDDEGNFQFKNLKARGIFIAGFFNWISTHH